MQMHRNGTRKFKRYAKKQINTTTKTNKKHLELNSKGICPQNYTPIMNILNLIPVELSTPDQRLPRKRKERIHSQSGHRS